MKKSLFAALFVTLLIGVNTFLIAWPGSSVDTTDVDQATDDPSQARADIHDAFNKLNDIIDDRNVANGVAGLNSSGKVFFTLLDSATTSQIGAAELATDAEAQAGTDTARIVTPSAHASTHFRRALVYHNANQTVTDSTTTTLSFNSESVDTDAIHDTATNNSRLTVPSGVSLVRLSGKVTISAGTTGQIRYQITKNTAGTAYAGSSEVWEHVNGSSSQDKAIVRTAILSVTSGDYFELKVFQDSGSSKSVTGSSGQHTWFEMEILQ